MAFDYKKEYKDLYQPKRMPAIVTVPAMRFVAVDGVGDPNEEGGDYAKAMQLLYGISFTIKMNKKSNNPDEHIDGYFDYTVPPLEGLWSMEKGVPGAGHAQRPVRRRARNRDDSGRLRAFARLRARLLRRPPPSRDLPIRPAPSQTGKSQNHHPSSGSEGGLTFGELLEALTAQ